MRAQVSILASATVLVATVLEGIVGCGSTQADRPAPTVTVTQTVQALRSPSRTPLPKPTTNVNATSDEDARKAMLSFLDGPDCVLILTVKGEEGRFEKDGGTVTITPSHKSPRTMSVEGLRKDLASPEPAGPTDGTDEGSPDLKLLSWKWDYSNRFMKQIVGKVKNVGSNAYTEVKIEYTLFDKDGSIVGSASAHSSNEVPRIPAGKTWVFRIGITGDPERTATKAEFRRVVGE